MKQLEELNLDNKKLIIFDMDGTLIDSIGIWNETDQVIIKEYGNKDVDLDIIQKERDDILRINHDKDIYVMYSEYLINKYNFNVKDVKEFNIIRRNRADKKLEYDVDYKEGVVELISMLKDMGYILALATVSTEHQIDIYTRKNKRMLEQMNILDTFDLIIKKEDVNNKKPDPEIFNKIREYYGLLPEECLIFEDAYIGVLAGKRANIEVVNVYDKYSDKDRDNIDRITDYKIDSFNDFIKYVKKYKGMAMKKSINLFR